MSCSTKNKMSENVLLNFIERFVPRIYTLKRLNTHWNGCFAAAFYLKTTSSPCWARDRTVSHTGCTCSFATLVGVAQR